MLYQDFENKKLRNLTAEEVCAMYHFHNEYARMGIGAIAFHASLTEGDKNFIARMVKDVVRHAAQHSVEPTLSNVGKSARKNGSKSRVSQPA